MKDCLTALAKRTEPEEYKQVNFRNSEQISTSYGILVSVNERDVCYDSGRIYSRYSEKEAERKGRAYHGRPLFPGVDNFILVNYENQGVEPTVKFPNGDTVTVKGFEIYSALQELVNANLDGYEGPVKQAPEPRTFIEVVKTFERQMRAEIAAGKETTATEQAEPESAQKDPNLAADRGAVRGGKTDYSSS